MSWLSTLEDLTFCVIMPHMPYLVRKNERELTLTRFPFAGAFYDFEQAIVVLKIFTDRWKNGGSSSMLEPYMEVDQEGHDRKKFSLRDLEMRLDTDEFMNRISAIGLEAERQNGKTLRAKKKKLAPVKKRARSDRRFEEDD